MSDCAVVGILFPHMLGESPSSCPRLRQGSCPLSRHSCPRRQRHSSVSNPSCALPLHCSISCSCFTRLSDLLSMYSICGLYFQVYHIASALFIARLLLSNSLDLRSCLLSLLSSYCSSCLCSCASSTPSVLLDTLPVHSLHSLIL